MTKYCVNCKFFSPKEDDPHHLYARCSGGTLPHPVSLVTGLPKYGYELPYAEVQRTFQCGSDAKFYEEKAKPQIKYQPQYTSPFVKGDD